MKFYLYATLHNLGYYSTMSWHYEEIKSSVD